MEKEGKLDNEFTSSYADPLLSRLAKFRIVDWRRAIYAIDDEHYISICTVQDLGGNHAVVYRTAYACGINMSKDPPRPAHQLAMRSVDVKNPHGLGLPTFVLQSELDESSLDLTRPADEDRELWDKWCVSDVAFSSLFWHNPQAYSGDVRIASAGGGKGCLYDLIKVANTEMELRLVHDGDQNAAEVDAMLTKAGWWKST